MKIPLILFILTSVGSAEICRVSAPSDVKNLTSTTGATEVNSTWFEAGFVLLNDVEWVSVSTTFSSFLDGIVFVSLPEISGETSADGYPAIRQSRVANTSCCQWSDQLSGFYTF